jgi:hypothetical protein
MKKNLSLGVLLLAISAGAQSYSLSTNLFFTNTIQSGVTLTYLGTNCLDLTHYKTFAVVATGSGTNISTNTITFTFKASADNTNYDNATTFTLTGTANGTTPFYLYTNLSAGDGIGYVKPFQIVSSLTNTVTNCWTWGVVKMFPRN